MRTHLSKPLKRILSIGILAFIVFTFTSCLTATIITFQPLQSITIDGIEITKEMTDDGFHSWCCTDFYDDRPFTILVEAGYFSIEGKTYGYVLYGGSSEGEIADYQREGVNLCWYFGYNYDYKLVVKPDGTGLYYNFTGVPAGESIKASDVYKTHQR